MIIEKIEKKDNLSQSANIVENNINKLKALFPEIVTEGKIDFTFLQEVLFACNTQQTLYNKVSQY
jgi:adenine-specific DNA-methyltransferase